MLDRLTRLDLRGNGLSFHDDIDDYSVLRPLCSNLLELCLADNYVWNWHVGLDGDDDGDSTVSLPLSPSLFSLNKLTNLDISECDCRRPGRFSDLNQLPCLKNLTWGVGPGKNLLWTGVPSLDYLRDPSLAALPSIASATQVEVRDCTGQSASCC